MRGRSARLWAAVGAAAALTLVTATGAHAEGRGDIRVVSAVVNGGKSVTVGTAGKVTYSIAITVKDDSGVKKVSRVSTYKQLSGYGFADWTGVTCVKKSRTTSVCTATMSIDAASIRYTDDIDTNRTAGVWTVNATVNANDGDYWISDSIAAYQVRRAAKFTVAAPAKAAKGALITVSGQLTQANWESRKYQGYARQTAQLQFRKNGAARYSTVKTVKTDGAGKAGAKVAVTASGSWRWYYPGTNAVASTASAGAAVTLK
ncbi:hypothetical protein IAG44_13185 [Streptomyces roseirectus]|uniref:Calcium-binding protein n=1 Tax=Streptomyces roseirectus TaxID=2768066 RepID=A0A7H0IBZ0_9ACTN|nr:hypothetical protein [Streptomyces roseirectus]QNP70306.1 hypothetical protein IAG44_13185 [Streptomyces roseirectus]